MHQLQPAHKQKKARRIGRGGKKGTYSGRGMKGQRSRAGNRLQPRVRELFKRYPKLRGYRRPATDQTISVKLQILEKNYKAGEVVSPKTLAEKKIVGTIHGKKQTIKILDGGDISKALTIKQCEVSKNARTKIEKAGGKITE